MQISIHAPLTGCDSDLLYSYKDTKISIHAPLTGCDTNHHYLYIYNNISIHAPLTGCDSSAKEQLKGMSVFQSTHP